MQRDAAVCERAAGPDLNLDEPASIRSNAWSGVVVRSNVKNGVQSAMHANQR